MLSESNYFLRGLTTGADHMGPHAPQEHALIIHSALKDTPHLNIRIKRTIPVYWNIDVVWLETFFTRSSCVRAWVYAVTTAPFRFQMLSVRKQVWGLSKSSVLTWLTFYSKGLSDLAVAFLAAKFCPLWSELWLFGKLTWILHVLQFLVS